MPISIQCPECEKKMKVADTVAGKKIRCPACKAVIAVPAADEEFEAPEEEFETPDEETAVTEAPKKKKATEFEESKPRPKKPKKDDDDGYGFDAEDDEEEEEQRRKKKRRRMAKELDYDLRGRRRGEPHRGILILILGIVSVLFGCVCALPAWAFGGLVVNMATTDLAKMDNGAMDIEGRTLTTAGKACGIIGSALGLLNLILGIMYFAMNGGKTFP